MTLPRFRVTLSIIAAFIPTPAFAQGKPSPWFPVPAEAVYETGDAWTFGGKRYRLYGVQSCLRGTAFTNDKGVKRDCGEASLAMLVSLVRDLKPMCSAAANVDDGKTVLVFCFATMEQGRNKGSRIDLGTALVSLGYGFASIQFNGQPVYAPYLIAEAQAKNTKSGLWAYADMPDPNAIISRSYNSPKAPNSGVGPMPPAARKPQ